ncbi:hypothetical protein P5Y53_15845 [Dyella jiangningensis]|uniref:hypothetical protein n=1 Tax=Dyella jiangningensis TaxID=1379159 RepID=UPI00240F900B|nr:hypothetical protein [Dyella jiangningensis]MDG2539151.1 hypothetical protein [Dyella jiangningensis]
MKVAIGFKAHSGWAAAVAVGLQDEHPHLVDRQRLALVDTGDAAWARQPYHAAEGLTPSRADALVQRGVAAARETSAVCVDRWVQQLRDAGHDIAGGTVLTAPPMPAWTTAQILAVHIRMHQAEGKLFPDALAAAVAACGLPLGLIPERALDELEPEACPWAEDIASMGRWTGPPWGADQKHAAMAALVIFGARLH